MLYITNHDKPGLIGGIGSILGDAGVNIATFHLGRADAGGDAIALISIDEALTPDLLTKLQELPQIKQIKSLTF